MEARLTAIDRGQVLQYLGFKGDVLPPALEDSTIALYDIDAERLQESADMREAGAE